MKKFWLFPLVACAISIFVGCSHLDKTEDRTAVVPAATKALETIKAKYAPDARMAIFDIGVQKKGEYFVVTGEVDRQEAKGELLETFRQLGIKTVDQINVLPDPKLGDRVWGIVRISVANVRDNPGHSSELGTQVVMGNAVKLWKQQGSWYFVQSADRYLGWMEEGSFVQMNENELSNWNKTERLIVTDYEGRIRQQPTAGALPVSDIVAGALLKRSAEEGDWFKVELPDGRVGYLPKSAAENYEQWRESRQATPDNIEHTAKTMLGLPYLWGGTSTKAVDCSGFTKLVYGFNGIQLNRNASHQARQGVDIPLDPELSQLQKGDLLFFGSKGTSNKPERVSHVGIYLGNKTFIHSANMVRINSLDPKSTLLDERRLRGLLRARRYIQE